ncbi:myelin-oligodendrocyte glycoprotein-like [Trachinotus anak]|uniref:myelin-oligodendrocyte glycoprotein-like n=1 Tax=Trachinotus anak TaxID=443729 RepID=UPI0039F257AD
MDRRLTCASHLCTFILRRTVFPLSPVQGQSQLIGSSQPVVATVGDDVILPCHVEPRLNVEELVVEWWRPDVPPDPGDPLSHYRYVHRYLDNQDVEDMKIPSYAGRTVLFKDQLKHGNLSLKLMNAKLSDEGRYLCVLPQLQSKQRATVIQLNVEPRPVESRPTETTPQPGGPKTPEEERDFNGSWSRSGLIPAVVGLLVLVCAAVGFLHKQCQRPECETAPIQPA